MKKLAVIVFVLLAGLIALFAWWRRPVMDPKNEEAAAPAAKTAEIARVRTEARARGEIDISPCSAGGRVLDRDSGRGVAGALVQLRARGLGRPTTPDDPGAPLTVTSVRGSASTGRAALRGID